MKTPDVSLIIPSLNEANIIKETLAKVADFIRTNKQKLGSCEVIVVAPGMDATADIARQSAHLFDALQVIEPRRGGGKGADVRAGFAAAHGDLQLFFDADLSTPLEHILTMVQKLRDGADVVIGARRLHRIHNGFVRSVVSVGTNLLTRPLLPRIKDTQCGCKGFTRAAAQTLFKQQRSTGWGFDVELLLYAQHDKMRVAQVAIPDWHETRDEQLVGDNVAMASLKTFGELAGLYARTLVRWAERHYVLTISIAMLAIIAVCFWINPFASMWFDEAYTAKVAQQSIPALIHSSVIDVHPPLYYLLLKGWSALFGQSDFALRSLSMVAGALAGGVTLLLIRRLFGGKVMLGALPFIVFAPFLLRYDIEARMYALASLIGVVATYALVVAVHAKRVLPWLTYGVLVLVGMMTLYYLALIWLIHLAWVAWRHRSTLLPLITTYIGAALVFLPWFVLCWPNIQRAGLWVGPPTIVDQYNVFSLMLAYTPVWVTTPLTLSLVIGALLLLVILGVGVWRRATTQQRHGIALFGLYFLLPMVLLTLASTPPLKPAFLYRYFAHTLIGGYALIGVVAALAWRRWPKSVLVKLASLGMLGVLIFGTFSLQQIGSENLDAHRFPGAKQTVEFLRTHHASVIVADTPTLYFELDRYMPNNPNLYFYEGTAPISQYGGLATLYGSPQQVHDLSSLRTSPIWFVYSTVTPKMQLPSGRVINQAYQDDKYQVVLVY